VPPLPGFTFAEAEVLTTWSPLIFERKPAGGCLIGEAVRRTTEQNAGLDDLITQDILAAGHQRCVKLESRLQAINTSGRMSWPQVLHRRSLRVEEFSSFPFS